MHLADILALRPIPAAGLLMAITRRCPLHCAHCSTASTMAAEQHPEELFARFAATFRPDDRPQIVLLTGGEPMLRPRLVRTLAGAARDAGTRTMVLSGAYFAPSPPPAVAAALDQIDHFSVSLDVFHEREVARADVFRLMHGLRDRGLSVSFHVVGDGPGDPYLADVIAGIRAAFRDQVPILAGLLGPTGRARSLTRPEPPPEPGISDSVRPCAMAAWPTVAPDGTVSACCNQDVLDRRPIPGHLRLGHIAADSWTEIRTRCETSPVLRAIRVGGPHWAAGARSGPGYCSACRTLGGDTPRRPGPSLDFMETQVVQAQAAAGPVAFLRRYGAADHADLVTLGHPRWRKPWHSIPSAN